VERLQRLTLPVQEVEEPILQFINNLRVENEDELYRVSLLMEPRESSIN